MLTNEKTENLHDNEFQPAFNALCQTGRELLAAKAAANEAMEAQESEYGDLVQIAEEAEVMQEYTGASSATTSLGDLLKDQLAKK